jgi:hypothetical protein
MDQRFADGAYAFVCDPHEGVGMQGTLTVGALGGREAAVQLNALAGSSIFRRAETSPRKWRCGRVAQLVRARHS